MARTPSHLRSGMTLLELLGVILVSFIIWSFIFPASEGMVRNSRRRQAAADVHALANAVQAYRQEYGHFPGQEAGAWDSDIFYRPEEADIEFPENTLVSVDAARLLQCLSATNEVDNPRAIVFLEDNPSRIEDDVMLDPWGDPYLVFADGNGDGWIGAEDAGEETKLTTFCIRDNDFAGSRSHIVPGIRETVYVFSWGDSATNAVSTVEVRK